MFAESQPRESQIPPTSNLWLSRNVSKHATVVAPRRNFHIFHYASMYSFPYRCAISRLEATRGIRSNIRSFDRRRIVTKSHFVWSYHHREQADGGRKVLEQSIGDTRRSRQFIPLEFCQDPSVRCIGCNEKCQTRDRGSLRCLRRSEGWIVIAISFRAIERNVDSLQIGKYYCYWSYFKWYFILR